MLTNRQKTFIKGLRSTHGHAPYRMFEAFCEMAFCALAKSLTPPAEADQLEARYLKLVEVVGHDTTRRFAEMLGDMAQALHESDGRDFLSAIAMDENVRATNAGAGQFFTPFEVCQLMAKMTVHDAKALLETQPYLTIGEPAAGAGGMLLATIQELRRQGVDIAHQVWIDASDIALLCVHMTFIQLALVGASGIVRHRDTLGSDQWGGWWTPGSVRFLTRHAAVPEVQPAQEDPAA